MVHILLEIYIGLDSWSCADIRDITCNLCKTTGLRHYAYPQKPWSASAQRDFCQNDAIEGRYGDRRASDLVWEAQRRGGVN